MKKQGNLLVWIRFWLQENSSVNQTQIIIISFFLSWQILEMLVPGLVCSMEPSIFFLTNQTFRPLLLSDHRCPKICFNSNLHVVLLAFVFHSQLRAERPSQPGPSLSRSTVPGQAVLCVLFTLDGPGGVSEEVPQHVLVLI